MTARQRADATKSKTKTKAKSTAKTPAAEAGPVVTWRKKSFTLPTADEFPLEALEAEEAGRTLTALRLILGDAQYATWRAVATTAGDAEEFSRHIMRELGTGNR